jgi:hypothetical protein
MLFAAFCTWGDMNWEEAAGSYPRIALFLPDFGLWRTLPLFIIIIFYFKKIVVGVK